MGYTIYHHNDPDGYFGAAMSKELLLDLYGSKIKQSLKLCEVNYPKVFPLDKMDDNDIVVIVDVSFGESTIHQLKSVCEKAKRVIWIDHHATSKSEVVPVLEKEPIDNLEYYINTNFCGALNTYICLMTHVFDNYDVSRYSIGDEADSQIYGYIKNYPSTFYAKPKSKENDSLSYASKIAGKLFIKVDGIDLYVPTFLIMLDDYDCHKLRFEDSNYFVYAVRNEPVEYYFKFITNSKARNLSNYVKFSNQRHIDEVVAPLVTKGKIIVDFLNQDYNNEISNHFIADFSEYGGPKEVICMNSRGNSWVFSNYFDEYDMCCLFHFDKDHWSYSLYANDEAMARGVDCSIIAGKLGGGGHPGASGFSTKELLGVLNEK